MKERLHKITRSPLFLPILAAPVLFGIGVLLLSLREGYDGAWFYVLYFLLQILSATLFFFGVHRVFRAIPTPGMPRALTGAIPILVSLSVYHLAIAFYDAYVAQFEEAPTAVVYALLSFFTDSLVAEWALLFLSVFAAYLIFLRGEATPAKRRAARILTALFYFAYLAVGRIAEFRSYVKGHFNVADEKATVSFLLLAGFDLLLAAFGFFLLCFWGRTKRKGEIAE